MKSLLITFILTTNYFLKILMALIFLSWSKPEGREVATCLKDFLMKTLNIKNSEEIFISTQNISGDDGWYSDIRANASSAYIVIPCLTLNSLYSPWIHFETGIGSSIVENKPRKIIPFLFDISPNQIGPNLGMISYHQLVHSDEDELAKKYKIMLKALLYSIDRFLFDNRESIKPIFQSISFPRKYDSSTDAKIYKDHREEINAAKKRLINIKTKYQAYNFYISRPMQSVDEKDALEYQNMIRGWSKKSNYSFFFAKLNSDIEAGFSTSRMDILKQSQYFVLIYPKMIRGNVTPSSCLVELGGAIAYGKRIVLFIEQDANIPTIIIDLIGELGQQNVFTYSSIDDLGLKWEVFFKTIKEKWESII